MQLNDTGEVIDVHRLLELQLTVAPAPHIEPGFRIKLEGVVADIRSGQVFVNTPGAAQYSLNAKTAPQHVKVSINMLTPFIQGWQKREGETHR